MSPKRPKRQPFRARRAVGFQQWKENIEHVHELAEVREQSGNHTFIIDRCTGPNCNYEKARDLITPEGGTDGANNSN